MLTTRALAFHFDTQAPQMLAWISAEHLCCGFLPKIEARSVNAGLYLAFKHHFSFPTALAAIFGCIQNHVLNSLAFSTMPEQKRFQVLHRLLKWLY